MVLETVLANVFTTTTSCTFLLVICKANLLPVVLRRELAFATSFGSLLVFASYLLVLAFSATFCFDSLISFLSCSSPGFASMVVALLLGWNRC